jgi:hypothetical protein
MCSSKSHFLCQFNSQRASSYNLPFSEEHTREFSIIVAVSLATLILYMLDISTTLAVFGGVVSTKMGPENA